jgi:uncharacterized protein
MANVPDLPALVAATAPGERHAALLATPTDPSTEVPAIALRGARPGPTLLVTAGVHGAEYASIEAAYRLAALEPSALSGVLIVLPIVNRPAYRVRAIYGNPVDGKNLNRQFPGDPAGSFAPRLAHWLIDAWVRHADAYLDLHGGDLNEALTPFVLHARGDERARALAEAFGIPYVVASGSAGHSYTAAAALGVPAVLAEAGGQGLFPESDVLTLVDGAHRAMRHLGGLDLGAPRDRGRRRRSPASTAPRRRSRSGRRPRAARRAATRRGTRRRRCRRRRWRRPSPPAWPATGGARGRRPPARPPPQLERHDPAPRPSRASTMASGSSRRPVTAVASSRLGRQTSHWAIVSRITARARASGHSLRRRLVSYDRAPAARAASMAANTVSQAPSLIAWLMPDTCSTARRGDRRRGRSAGRMRLAAEPRR